MSRQTLDLTRSAQIVWRHKIFVGAVAALGLLGNTAYTMARPPVFTASALVALAPSANVSTQTVAVASAPVLTDALRRAGLAVSYETLQRRVRATRAAAQMIAITAQGDTAAEAERTANAVTELYRIRRLRREPARSTASPARAACDDRHRETVHDPCLHSGRAWHPARSADWPHRRARDMAKRPAAARARCDSGLGRLPVLASVRATSPSDAVGWEKLFQSYAPGPGDAWLLRKVLRELGLTSTSPASATPAAGSSVAVLSISGDRDALALGPQLAAFAASQGMRAALVVGPQQDAKATASLLAACDAASSQQPQNLRLVVTDHDDARQLPADMLTVVAAVVDGQIPHVTETMRAATTVLGVTAGAVTAQQLVRVAAARRRRSPCRRDPRRQPGPGRPDDRPPAAIGAPGRVQNADAHGRRSNGEQTMTDRDPTVMYPTRGNHRRQPRLTALGDFSLSEDQPADVATGLVSLGFIWAAVKRGARFWCVLAIVGLLVGRSATTSNLRPPTRPPRRSCSLTVRMRARRARSSTTRPLRRATPWPSSP